MRHIVEIDENLLIMIAAAGKLGDGATLKSHQLWAESECRRLNLVQKLTAFRKSNLDILRTRIEQTMGSQSVNKIDKVINETIKKMK